MRKYEGTNLTKNKVSNRARSEVLKIILTMDYVR
jgi:hypothetical protein